ncbi:MAG: hypothetical protein JXR86_03285 [Spirochaetales bacterium]|nr:hypothetical protein [Spirochaetales bacterium]
MKKSHFILIAVAVAAASIFISCAPGPNNMSGTVDGSGELAGFWMGLWHGCISFITFIISLFSDKVNVYEVHNKGNIYNLGFILGIMIAYGGSGGGAAKKRRK